MQTDYQAFIKVTPRFVQVGIIPNDREWYAIAALQGDELNLPETKQIVLFGQALAGRYTHDANIKPEALHVTQYKYANTDREDVKDLQIIFKNTHHDVSMIANTKVYTGKIPYSEVEGIFLIHDLRMNLAPDITGQTGWQEME